MRNFLFKYILFLNFGFCLGLSAKNDSSKLLISQLTSDCYIYTTYHSFNGKAFPSNSMYMLTDSGAVLFDTPWDSTQFQPLLDSIWSRHHVKAVLCISTHFHADRTAGLAYYQRQGIRTYSSYQTLQLCKQHHEKQARYFFMNDTVFKIGTKTVSTFYPGEGHSPDNIVLWIDSQRILYGGCFVKSTENNDLGNLSHANVKAWPKSVKRVMKRFPQAAFVIPGHFDWSNNKSLEHTLRLLKKRA